MHKILILFIAILFSGITYASNENCNCSLTNYVDDYLEIEQKKQKSDIQIKDLSEEELGLIVKKLCTNITLATSTGFMRIEFEEAIIQSLKIKPANEEEKNILIVSFLNKYKQKLICPKSKGDSNSRDLHIYKVAALQGITDLFNEILLDDEDFPGVDFNAYEIVDGKKETLVDYIEYLIGTNLYDNDELELLRDDLIELSGKRGSEL